MSQVGDELLALAEQAARNAGALLRARFEAGGIRGIESKSSPTDLVSEADVAAQRAIRDWAAGNVPVRLLGLVLIADAPGRLPHGLRQLAALIAGGVPAVWSLPWIEAWRIGDPPGPSNAPKAAERLLDDPRVMTEEATSENANRNEEE